MFSLTDTLRENGFDSLVQVCRLLDVGPTTLTNAFNNDRLAFESYLHIACRHLNRRKLEQLRDRL